MSLADALYWDATIQRDIATTALKEKSMGRPISRADSLWPWSGMRILFPLAELLKKRRCRALSIFVQDTLGRGVPAGMMLLIERYPWPFPNDSVSGSTFTWFIASAPKESLLKRRVPDPPSLGRIMVDAAIVTSLALGLGGRMWLHASPAGGAGLLRLYGSTCQMSCLPVGTRLPGGKLSDGRHFYVTEILANQLVDALQLAR